MISWYICTTLVVRKLIVHGGLQRTIPDIFSHNLSKRCPMLIYFGRYVMQELGDGHYYWDILLSREMKQVADESFVFTGQHTGASCVQHSPTAAA